MATLRNELVAHWRRIFRKDIHNRDIHNRSSHIHLRTRARAYNANKQHTVVRVTFA